MSEHGPVPESTAAWSDEETAGATGTVVRMASVAAIGGFLFGYDSAVINGAVAAIKNQFSAGSVALGLTVSSTLVGAALGAVTANLMFAATGQDPYFLVLILFTIVGAAAAMYLQRYFIIVGTAFGGAWTLIVGAMALLGNPGALAAAAAGDVWVAYPMNPAPGQRWLPVAWIVLGLIGTGVQLGWTGGDKGRVVRRKKKT